MRARSFLSVMIVVNWILWTLGDLILEKGTRGRLFLGQ